MSIGKFRWGSPQPQTTTEVVEVPKPPVAAIPDKYRQSEQLQNDNVAIAAEVFADVSPEVATEAIGRAQLDPAFKQETVKGCFLIYKDRVLKEKAGKK